MGGVNNKDKIQVDWVLLIATVCLMIVGILFIASAKMGEEADLKWYDTCAFRQGLWYLIGSVIAAGVCFIDYKFFCRYSLLGYWVVIALLLLVLVPSVGTLRFGARRWFDLHFLQLQPSEFAKLAYIFAAAHFFSRPRKELKAYHTFFKCLGMTALPFLLILAEPDLGSSLVFIPMGGLMMYVAGVPLKYLSRIGGAGVLVIALFVVDVVYAPEGWRAPLEDYQRRRLLVYFGQDYSALAKTEAERQQLVRQQRADSYNIEQALISVGTGGLVGKGWKEGTQASLGFLPRPVAHNDFIFSVIAEETGFLGSTFVICLYGAIFFSGIRTASQSRDGLGRLLSIGVVALLFTHVMINIGMNIRLMPVTGIPLPLLSYGGSSVVCSLLAIGMLQNVYIYRKKY